jgi:hypothetical protein
MHEGQDRDKWRAEYFQFFWYVTMLISKVTIVSKENNAAIYMES